MWDKLSQEYLACGVVGRGMIKFPIVICMDFALLWSFSVVSCVTFDIFIGLVSLVWSGYFYISTVERIRWILLLIKVVSFSCGNIIYIRCGMYSRIILFNAFLFQCTKPASLCFFLSHIQCPTGIFPCMGTRFQLFWGANYWIL